MAKATDLPDAFDRIARSPAATPPPTEQRRRPRSDQQAPAGAGRGDGKGVAGLLGVGKAVAVGVGLLVSRLPWPSYQPRCSMQSLSPSRSRQDSPHDPRCMTRLLG